MDNPLLALDALPAFDRIRPEHVDARRSTRCWPRPTRRWSARSATTVPADYDALSAVLDVATERLVARLGRGAPSQRGGRHAGAARGLHREPAAHHRVPHPARRRRAPVRQVQGRARRARRAAQLSPARRQALANAMRDFVLSGAELQGAAQASASRRSRSAQAELAQQLLRARARRDRRLRAATSSEAELDGVPDDVQPGRARRRAGRRPRRLQADAALPELLPGDAVRHATARCARQLYTAYVTRASELGPAERDNGPLMRELLALRQEEARLLGKAQLRRGVAGAEDGRVAAAGDRLPARPGAARPPRRRARPGRAARVRARASSACPSCRPGTCPSPASG